MSESSVKEYSIPSDLSHQQPFKKKELKIAKFNRDYRSEETIYIRPKTLEQADSQQTKSIEEARQGQQQRKQDTITTYNKQTKWFDIFSCCKEPEIDLGYEDCDICEKRVYKYPQDQEQEEEVPYMSAHRMKARERQPLNTFYDQLKNEELKSFRWADVEDLNKKKKEKYDASY